jgi:hypothetical protein
MDRKSFLALIMKHAIEMADEAEHQDGDTYWEAYKTDEEAIRDFALYLDSIIEPLPCGTCGIGVNSLEYASHMRGHA